MVEEAQFTEFPRWAYEERGSYHLVKSHLCWYWVFCDCTHVAMHTSEALVPVLKLLKVHVFFIFCSFRVLDANVLRVDRLKVLFHRYVWQEVLAGISGFITVNRSLRRLLCDLLLIYRVQVLLREIGGLVSGS
jgi:hypothetical protein